MKKLIIFLLTLSLLLSTFSISALANEVSNIHNSSNEPIGVYSDEPQPKDFEN